ncbi:hypothetical protein [Tsukamurella pulmonis]|uniref:hypothetical protein n=1 Tax=Tsukamurella pulmonis TaxID=47312 RepID=UPI001058FE25|nr:hypothetical protein [Tsukamurella pulmonis]
MDMVSPIAAGDSAPRLVDYTDIEGILRLDIGSRKALLAECNLVESLTYVSGLLSRLDLSVIDDTSAVVQTQFVRETSFSQALIPHVLKGNAVLHPTSILELVKEIIEFADAGDGGSVIGADTCLKCLLNISGELSESAAPKSPELESALQELTLSRVAQYALAVPETFETLTMEAESVWNRPWSRRTSEKNLADLASAPSLQFEDATGIALDDLFALGQIIFNLWKHEGHTRIDPAMLRDFGIPIPVLEFFLQHCSKSIPELRAMLTGQRQESEGSPWVRYQIQQSPFVRLDDDMLIPIRFQFAMQRLLGDHLYLESQYLTAKKDKKRGARYKAAMDDIFEERVGEVLTRISDRVRKSALTLITDPQMRGAWYGTSSDDGPQICDFVLVRGDNCVVIDANNRSLPQPLAEGTATYEEFKEEIEGRFSTTKFVQLQSTIRLLDSSGWRNRKGQQLITEKTIFVPIVVAPDSGLPADMTTEFELYQRVPNIMTEDDGELRDRVLPPSVLNWRGLGMLDALSEKREDVVDILRQWRSIDPRVGSFPMTFEEWLAMHALTPPISQRMMKLGFDFFERITRHACELNIRTMPPFRQDEARRRMELGLAQRPRWRDRR